MGNAVICYKNQVDEAVLSGGSWISKLPLTNMQNYVQSKVSRSSDLDPTSTQFTATWDEEKTIAAFALANHNLEIDSQIRLRVFNSLGATVFDTGFFEVWPAVYSSEDLEWEDNNFWTAQFKLSELQNVRWTFIYLFSTPQLGFSMKVELLDPSNTKGYVDIGRPHIAAVAWEPAVNMSEGAALYFETNTTVDRSLAGTKYFDPKNQYKVAQFNLNNMSQNESMTRSFDMQQIVGIDKEVIFIWDRSDTVHQVRRRFVGTLRELKPIEVPNYERHRTSYSIEESL